MSAVQVTRLLAGVISVAVAITDATVALARTDRWIVNGVAFCIPERNIQEEHPWVPRNLPGNLPDIGVGYVLGADFYQGNPELKPGLDFRGRPMRMFGTLMPVERYAHYARPRPGGFYYERAADPGAKVETLDAPGLVAVYHGGAQRGWVVWQVPTAEDARPGRIAAVGRVIAVCSVPAGQQLGWPSTSCERFMTTDRIAISYDFVFEDIGKYEVYDQAILNQIKKWSC